MDLDSFHRLQEDLHLQEARSDQVDQVDPAADQDDHLWEARIDRHQGHHPHIHLKDQDLRE
jgi:hypothetical protein